MKLLLCRYLFSWELIHAFLNLYIRPTAISYQSFWESQIEVYLSRGLISLEQISSFMNLRSVFQDCVVSFIILQKIDWSEMICDCGGDKGVILDGTKVAMKSLSSLLQQAWRVPPSQERRHQTDASQLVFLAGANERALELLRKFSSSPKRY